MSRKTVGSPRRCGGSTWVRIIFPSKVPNASRYAILWPGGGLAPNRVESLSLVRFDDFESS